MSLSVQMSVAEAKQFFADLQMPASETITLSFEDSHTDYIEQLRQQRAIAAIKSFQGSGSGGSVEALLMDRANDRENEHC